MEDRRAPEARTPPASLPFSAVRPKFRTLDVARRALVRVEAVDRVAVQRSGDGGGTTRTGFGFVVSESGIILTAGRLVAGATKVAVVLPDGRTVPVTAVAMDSLNDLAVLQVKERRLRAVLLGSSGI